MRRSVDAEDYHDHMEPIDSDIMERTFRTASMDISLFTGKDVMDALYADRLDPYGFAALLSPAAETFLEDMAERAKEETQRYFGNSVNIFTPLYISNYCDNGCAYCGFNGSNNIRRAKLSLKEIEAEMARIAESGLTEILILTGESRGMTSTEFMGDCVETATKYFRNIGLEVYPLNISDYRHLRDRGADYVTVFQETYDPVRYEELHPYGPKRVFSYRFDSQERALIGGMRGVAFGALLGLGDFRKDSLMSGIHAYLLQRKYPHAEISISLPRLRPFLNGEYSAEMITERQLLQIALAYRIFMPFAGQTISSRESQRFRDNMVGLSATKISAGVSVGIGGHSEDKKGDDQFDISDPRTVEEIRKALTEKGLQPVFNDYVRT